jgi:hypothetical protein
MTSRRYDRLEVRPRRGSALNFDEYGHLLQGAAVTRGHKYVRSTDVRYRLERT